MHSQQRLRWQPGSLLAGQSNAVPWIGSENAIAGTSRSEKATDYVMNVLRGI